MPVGGITRDQRSSLYPTSLARREVCAAATRKSEGNIFVWRDRFWLQTTSNSYAELLIRKRWDCELMRRCSTAGKPDTRFKLNSGS